MRKGVLKAVISLLTLSHADGGRLSRDHIILIVSTIVTIGLVALYVHGELFEGW